MGEGGGVSGKQNLELADDQMCFGCGSRNNRGLKLQFELDTQNRRLKTCWIPAKEFQGYRDIVHGGMIGLVLDEMMVNLLWALKQPAVTAELKLRLSRPAKVGEALDCEAWIVSEEGRIVRTEGAVKNRAGEMVARATARCVKIEGDKK